MSAPNSSITIYRCNLNPNGLFTCDFSGGSTSESGVTSSGAARDSYFSSPDGTLATSVYTGSNYTFIRKDMTVTVATNADTLNAAGANYCRFINPTYSGRWFYAFITKIEYVAEQTTKIYIRTDVFTTYFDVITRNETMVEREHVYNDTAFKHTLEEPTPHFEQFMRTLAYKKWDGSTSLKLRDNFYGVMHGTGGPYEHYSNFIGSTWQPGMTLCADPLDVLDLGELMTRDQMEVVWTTYMPIDGVAVAGEVEPGGIYRVHGRTPDTVLTIQSRDQAQFLYRSGEDSYTVRNKKLNCFPYSCIEMNDFWGQRIILKPELMKSNDFYISYELCDTPSITMRYTDYESDGDSSFKNQISLSDLPEVVYDINYYTQFVALHKNQLSVQQTEDEWRVMKSVLNLPAAYAKGSSGDITGGVDLVMNGVFQHFEREAMLSDMKQRPPLTHYSAVRNERIGTDTFGFRVNHYYPTREYAEILDDFFDRFGYNVTEVKTPCWNTRAGYNFIQTNGANLGGTIPIEDKGKLNQLFDAGITIWHTASNYGKYNISNLAPVR